LREESKIVFKKGKKERHTKSMIRKAGNRGRRNNELYKKRTETSLHLQGIHLSLMRMCTSIGTPPPLLMPF
jgi:hypothetical protein